MKIELCSNVNVAGCSCTDMRGPDTSFAIDKVHVSPDEPIVQSSGARESRWLAVSAKGGLLLT